MRARGRHSRSFAQGVKELGRKLETVAKALRWMEAEGLAPAGVPAAATGDA